MMTPSSPSWSRFFVPEIHDVHGAMGSALDDLLALLPEEARAACALLVVPNWQDRALLTPDSALCRQLKTLPGPKVLHGWTHSLGMTWLSRLLEGHDARGEFAKLSEAQASVRLQKGVDLFSTCLGETPRWFCAPQWRQSKSVGPVLARTGLAHTQFMNTLLLDHRDPVPLQAVNFDVGDRKTVQAVNRILRKRQISRLVQNATPFRLTLHPADLTRSDSLKEIKELLDILEGEGWRSLSLDEAASLWREQTA